MGLILPPAHRSLHAWTWPGIRVKLGPFCHNKDPATRVQLMGRTQLPAPPLLAAQPRSGQDTGQRWLRDGLGEDKGSEHGILESCTLRSRCSKQEHH